MAISTASQGTASQGSSTWRKRRWEIVTICQVAAIFIVIITCVINLSIGTDKAELWSSLLSGGLCYLLPFPKFKKNGTLLLNSTQQQFPQLLPGEHLDDLYNPSGQSDQIAGGVGMCPHGD